MSYVADLHIHSRYSQACSKELNIPNLSMWAKYKGIDLLGTGDCFHPLWQKELKKTLKNFRNGVYEYDGIKFLITNEVSCIYSEGGRTRRIHVLILLPGIDSAVNISRELSKKGIRLDYDGRPILGWSVKKLCEFIYEKEPEALIIPAHIWTPWFGMLGSKAGFDSLKECFGEFSDNVYGVETGLSSEPAMNWRVEELDNKSIVSFSDAHSLAKLGREVTVFKGNCTFKDLKMALKEQYIDETIEFFPEEGKYHYSGHRSCNVSLSAEEVQQKGVICSVCKKPLTIGVMQRAENLAKRNSNALNLKKEGNLISSQKFNKRAPFRMLVSLSQILAEAIGVGVSSKKIRDVYTKLVKEVAPELKILTESDANIISKIAGERVAIGIDLVRKGNIKIEPGFDNTYGKVKIF